MDILEFEFEGKVIEFDMSGPDVMINATEMGRVYGKEPYDFTKQEGTKRYMAVLKTSIPAFRSDPESERQPEIKVLSDENILRSERGGDEGGGTWMHRQLALKFAAWLDPRFEVWVFQKIDELMFDYSKKTTEELKEKAKLIDRKDELFQKLQPNPDFQEYLQIEFKIKQTNNRITKVNNNQLGLFRSN
ncbi:KilA-N domain-containing protein [bacterium]|nr:MAG: KilA-N domain-containing protein [bacterium]